MHLTIRNVVFTGENMIFNRLEYQTMFLFLKLVKFINKLIDRGVMNYAGAVRAPIQKASVCTKTDMSWDVAHPVTQKQRPTASVTSRSIPSVSRSVGTTTRVTGVKKTVAPAKLSPPKKGEKSNKPPSPKQHIAHVHESNAYFTVKTHKV